MFKFLFRISDRKLKEGLQRYVELEYRIGDRAAAFERLLKEARL